MKRLFIAAIAVLLTSSCQVGSETTLRVDQSNGSSQKQSKIVCDLPVVNHRTKGTFVYETADVNGCVESSTKILEMAPLGWHGVEGEDPLMTWEEANRALKDLKINGVGGWRLPTGWELISSCEYKTNCTAQNYPLQFAGEMPAGDSELGLQMKMEGEIAANPRNWWWTRTSLSDDSFAAVMTPLFRRTFADKSEKFRVRPIRVERQGKSWSNPEWKSDNEEISNLTCFQSSRNEVEMAWRDICSKFQMCGNWNIRGCVSAVSDVTSTALGFTTVVVNDESIDTYTYSNILGWKISIVQKVPSLLDPSRSDGSTSEVALVDITKDGNPELLVRRGPANFYMAADSANMAAFKWSSSSGGWIRIFFPTPSDPDWIAYDSEGKYRTLRWGFVRDGEVFEEFGYLRSGGHVDDVAIRYQWNGTKFTIVGNEKISPACYAINGVTSGFCYGE